MHSILPHDGSCVYRSEGVMPKFHSEGFQEIILED
jgi:hypothetical protein